MVDECKEVELRLLVSGFYLLMQTNSRARLRSVQNGPIV